MTYYVFGPEVARLYSTGKTTSVNSTGNFNLRYLLASESELVGNFQQRPANTLLESRGKKSCFFQWNKRKSMLPEKFDINFLVHESSVKLIFVAFLRSLVSETSILIC